MNLTGPQLATLKAWIVANRGSAFDADTVAALNVLADPAYYVFRANVTRSEVYKTAVAGADSSTGSPTSWVWAGFKAQEPKEQTTWVEMMMGGCNFGVLNNRAGALEIFGTAGNGGLNRVHIFNVARRRVTVFEKLFAAAVVAPPANTGNTAGQPRGSVLNPDTLGIDADGEPIEGLVTLAIVEASEGA